MDKKTLSNNFLIIGLLLAAAYWILESLVEDWVFEEGAFFDRLLLTDTHEIEHRLITTFLIILFGLLAQTSFKRQKRSESEIKEINEKLSVLSEERRIMLETSQDMVYRHDVNGNFNYISQAIEKITGYKPEDWYMHYTSYLTDNPVNKKAIKYTEETLKTGKESPPYLVEICHKDGRRVMLEVREHAYFDGGKIAGIIGIGRDVTNQKKAEEMIVRQSTELGKINSELSAIHRVSMIVPQTMDMEKLLSEVLRTVTELDILSVERKGVVFAIEDEKMRLVYDLGHNDEFIGLHREMKVGDCLCGFSAGTGEVMVSGDSNSDTRHTITYPGMTPHGHIIVPLKAEERIVGVMCLYLPAGAEVDEGKKKMLVSIGNQIGLAMENIRLYNEAKALSLKDPLTGLGNRRYMEIRMEDAFARSKRYGSPLSTIMLDIDFFKRYNDTHGHQAGDDMLTRVARTISGNIRETDFAVRYGGEEFIVLLPETTLPEVLEAAERIRKSVKEETGVTVSLGAASWHAGMNNKEELIKRSDEALYIAKQKGRNRVESLQ